MKHTRHKFNLNHNPKRTKGKKGYKYKKSWWGGTMSLSKHRKVMWACWGHNHAISLYNTREFNREEEEYRELLKKRKGKMFDNVILLFRSYN